jgi:curved DNA-binding protein
MDFTDYYAVLGVPRDASQDAVKKAYRALARKLHPDVNKDAGAEDRFKRVNEAYEVLKEPEKRRKYDQLGSEWEQLERQEEFAQSFRRRNPGRAPAGAGATGYSDFFETFFGSGGVDLDELLRRGGGSSTVHFSFGDSASGTQTYTRPTARPGQDIDHDVEISVEEAAHGAVRLLQIGARQVEVRIPAGVTEGSRVRVGGEGGHGRGGGPKGDLYLNVRLQPHPRFTVRGRDVATDLPVRDDQAVLGAQVAVQGVTGSLTVTVPAGTQAGRVLRLRGKGLPALRGGTPGDLLLTVRITVPASPNEEERELYQRLADLRAAADAGPGSTPPSAAG